MLIAVVLILTLQKQGKETALLLSIAACCMTAVLAFGFLRPVISFLESLMQAFHLDSTMLTLLLKVVGISITGEVAGLICADSGNAALGKVLQLVTAAAVLWLSLPMFKSLLDLVETILGTL